MLVLNNINKFSNDIYSKSNRTDYLEWIVVIAVAYATTFTVTENYIKFFVPNLWMFFGLLRNIVLLLLLFFHISYFGASFKDKGLFFFFLYCVYIFLYITVFSVYRLDDLIKAPTSLFNFFYRTIQVFIYILCYKTILKHFNIAKFLIISFFTTLVPSIAFIQYVGVDTLQFIGLDNDDNPISCLALGYCSGPLVVLSILFHRRLFKNKIQSILFSLLVILLGSFILFVVGERGPLVWTIVNLMICSFIITKRKIRFGLIACMLSIMIYFNIGFIIDTIDSFAPRTAERLELTIEEGDTNGRFDTDDVHGSTYIIGLNQFYTSPWYGSYFRLITNYMVFRGHYPHNVFIEILMTMGLLGFIPFIYLLWIAWKKTKKVMKKNVTDRYLAFVALFLSSFLQLMTTSTILFHTAFWLFFIIMCNFDVNLTADKSTNKRLLTNSNI